VKKHAFIREGIPTIMVLIVVTLLLYFLYPILAIIGIGLIIFVLYFFRDPVREILDDENAILAPADGIITNITEVDETSFMKGSSIRISIFMSPLDVHINRSPVAGKVTYINYKKGKFISATKPESHDVNEKNFIGIEHENFRVLVVQIAGIMARRIVNWTNNGQSLKKGDKIGMIKFSSGTQLYLPRNTQILVKKGDKLEAGKTIVGRY